MSTTPETETSAKAVANFFLEKGKEEGIPIDHLKLQKLVYFAYAWWSGNFPKDLFPDDIEAWRHGPVVRSLWNEFKGSGREPLRKLATDFQWSDDEIGPPVVPQITEARLRKNLTEIWNGFKKYSPVQLSNATHAKNEPWSIVRAEYPSNEQQPIPPSLIRQIYSERVVKLRDAKLQSASAPG